MKSFVEIISENTIETDPSILITIEGNKYLIGCGENIQRSLIENKISIGSKSLRCIIIPSQRWDSIGGLFGFLMRHADSGAKEIVISGYLGLKKIISFSSFIVYREDFKIETIETESEFLFKDDFISISGIENNCKKGKSLCVFCHIRKPQRKVNKEKIRSFEINGLLIRKLLKGETVCNKKGETISPDDILETQKKGGIVSYIDLRSKESLLSLLEQRNIEELKKYQIGGKYEITVAYHFISKCVYEDERYKKLIENFGPNCQNLFFSFEKKEEIVYKSHFNLQLLFSEQDKKLFNVPFHKETVLPYVSIGKMIKINNLVILEPTFSIKEIEEKNIFNRENKEVVFPIESTISFLGTGASIPSKYRNVTGIHLDIKNHGGIIFDCGEGSFGQISRLFGTNGLFFEKLKAIFISHEHLDHYLGLVSILIKKSVCINKNIIVFTHGTIIEWIKKLFSFLNISIDYVSFEDIIGFRNKTISLCTEIKVSFVEVDHHTKMNSFGFALTSEKEKWCVGYSGDTRPCKNFIEMFFSIKDKKIILIHDTTFEETEQKRALITKHSTIKEAFYVFKEIKASFCIFTHFSQRNMFLDFPIEIEQTLDFGKNFVLAFDFMSLEIEKILKQEDCFFKKIKVLKKIFEERNKIFIN